jgi:pimeloyl-ACP methyl ester carboxylesterase
VPTASENGVHLWYDVKGSGPAVSLIGGFALIDNQWDYVVDDLAERHTVVNWCFRGSGKSDWTMPSQPSIDQFAEDLRIVLDAAGIEKTAVWATSTGAPVGLHFAAKYPERTTALITYPWYKTDDTWRGIMDAAYYVGKYFGVDQMSRMFAGSVFPADLLYAKEGLDYERWAKKVYLQNLNPETLRQVIDVYKEVDLTGDVTRLQCPTLLLMGNDSIQNDRDFMKEVSFDYLTQAFMKLKPDAELATIPDAGSTYCMITSPKKCSDAALEFLARVLPETQGARTETVDAA